MTRTPDLDRTIAGWARLGILFGSRAARRPPDVERLLLETARVAAGSARLFYAVVEWLSRFGNAVARHRLKHLAATELPVEGQPLLGAMLGVAVGHGGSRELLLAARACCPSDPPRPAFDVHRGDVRLERMVERLASPAALPWNLWLPDQSPGRDRIRPTAWVLARNPGLADRAVRRGDLRSTILLTLRCDACDGRVESEAELARLCSANRLAVRKALDDLELEGHFLRRRIPGRRGISIAFPEDRQTA